VDHPTLVIAVKSHCDGCRDFIYGSLDRFGSLRVLLACEKFDDEWLDAPRPVYEAPALLAALDVRSPPFYVLLLAPPSRVVVEGIAFTSEQVASEIASALA